jgi:DNA-directed RNA polymerase subunit M
LVEVIGDGRDIMLFCKCGALLLPKNGKMVCPECKTVSDSDGRITEKKTKKKEVEVMNKGDLEEKHPEVTHDCEECGHTRCFFWTKQTRSSDEPETKFYKCCKCGHTWREYD